MTKTHETETQGADISGFVVDYAKRVEYGTKFRELLAYRDAQNLLRSGRKRFTDFDQSGSEIHQELQEPVASDDPTSGTASVDRSALANGPQAKRPVSMPQNGKREVRRQFLNALRDEFSGNRSSRLPVGTDRSGLRNFDLRNASDAEIRDVLMTEQPTFGSYSVLPIVKPTPDQLVDLSDRQPPPSPEEIAQAALEKYQVLLDQYRTGQKIVDVFYVCFKGNNGVKLVHPFFVNPQHLAAIDAKKAAAATVASAGDNVGAVEDGNKPPLPTLPEEAKFAIAQNVAALGKKLAELIKNPHKRADVLTTLENWAMGVVSP